MEPMKVLVAYATRHGSTQGIAARIARRLEEHGLEVVLQPVGEVRKVEEYGAYVIGAAAYFFHWLKEATDFVHRYAPLLGSRPTWLFSSGPLGTDEVDAQGRNVRETSEPREFAELIPLVHPRGRSIFFGVYDPEAAPIGLMERFSRAMPAVRNAMPAGDFRNWKEIDAWADSIASELAERDPVAAG
jgi:menaquinone-dependent protoporphyrinogen oxidase